MSARLPHVLVAVPPAVAGLWTGPMAKTGGFVIVVHGQDAYAPQDIDYVFGFYPPIGLLKTLPNLKAAFSLGAGVDGFLRDPDYPRHVPLVRFVDRSVAREMAQYVVLQVLLHHREQRKWDAAQREGKWRQALPARFTEDTRIGILGMGELGAMAAERLRDLDFKVAGWSRTRKRADGVESFAGDGELEAFLARSDIVSCLLPLTPATHRILSARTFAMLPKGAYVINSARGGHLNADDLIAALDSGQLSGASLDVFEAEPLPESSPLWRHPKIRVTPHVAAISYPAVAARIVAEGIARAERGEALDNVVDVARGY